MRIVYDYQIFFIQAYGGVSRYFAELAARIPAVAGDETLVLAPLHVNEHLPRRGRGVLGLKIPRLPRTYKLGKIANELATAAAMRAFRPDIAHDTYYRRPVVPPPAKTKLVVTVHDMIHELFPELMGREAGRALAKSQAVRRADHVICVSENTRNDLLRFIDIDAAKVSVALHGVTRPAPAKRPRLIERPYVLYVGHRPGYKNFQRLAEAFASSRARRDGFVLACFGSERFTPSETTFFASLGLDESSVLHMAGGDDALNSLYANAAIFAYPSLYEGFGMPVLEAMVNDCPVACARSSSIPEVAGDAAEYFDPCSVEDMSRAMEDVLYSDDRRRELVALGRRRVERFTWDACARRTRDVYASLL